MSRGKLTKGSHSEPALNLCMLVFTISMWHFDKSSLLKVCSTTELWHTFGFFVPRFPILLNCHALGMSLAWTLSQGWRMTSDNYFRQERYNGRYLLLPRQVLRRETIYYLQICFAECFRNKRRYLLRRVFMYAFPRNTTRVVLKMIIWPS